MGTSMIGNRMCALALSAASALICFAPPASAAKFDGNWSMTAVTTRGHCGTIPIGMGVAGGRIYSTGGSFAFYSISLGGRVSNSGSVSLKAVAGPRVAHGTGRFTRVRGSGTWKGRGRRVCARACGAPRAADVATLYPVGSSDAWAGSHGVGAAVVQRRAAAA